KLFDLKSVSLSETVQKGRSYSSCFSSFKHVVGARFSPLFCPCGGKFPPGFNWRTSKNTCLSKKSNGSVKGENLTTENYPYKIDRTNASIESLFSRNMRLLEAVDDEYGGVVVDPESLPANPNVFGSVLNYSLSNWKIKACALLKTGKKGIWLKVPLELSELVPVAVKAGFQYHHAEQGYVMLTYWIPEGPCMLPANASHQVGVGGFVINDENEVLVVQEKHCSPAVAGLWKIPTGFILESEEIYNGVAREVKEETGIDTEFVEIIAFRHAHNVAFDKSDLLFVCMLRPLSTQIKIDGLEIQAAKWMPLVEFVEQPLIQEDCMFKKIVDIFIARLGKRYCGLSTNQVVSRFDGRPSSLYYNVIDTNDDSNCTTGN
ncbi:NUDIX domain-containing protein, partial [Cephalotus follicularis]